MTDPRITALEEAVTAAWTVHVAAMALEYETGVEMFDKAAIPKALTAAILAALPPDWCGHGQAGRYQRALEVEEALAAEDREKYRAEIVRLRAALKRIADFSGEPEAVMARQALRAGGEA